MGEENVQLTQLQACREMDRAKAECKTRTPSKKQKCSLEDSSGSSHCHMQNSSKDVLARGGAALTNRGNVYFNKLCEERYDEYAALDAHHADPRRLGISREIVEAVLNTGGVFRDSNGGELSLDKATRKARDRLRAIGTSRESAHVRTRPAPENLACTESDPDRPVSAATANRASRNSKEQPPKTPHLTIMGNFISSLLVKKEGWSVVNEKVDAINFGQVIYRKGTNRKTAEEGKDKFTGYEALAWWAYNNGYYRCVHHSTAFSEQSEHHLHRLLLALN